MKKAFSLLAFSVLLTATSCVKEKTYTCECTYVADAIGPSSGQPNKTERETLKSTFKTTAEQDCDKLESKYFNQFYSGSCLLK